MKILCQWPILPILLVVSGLLANASLAQGLSCTANVDAEGFAMAQKSREKALQKALKATQAFENQQTELALKLARQALFLAQLDDHQDLLFRLQWQLARLHRAMGKNDQALVLYRRALQLGASASLASLASSGSSDDIHHELVDLLLREAKINPDQRQRLLFEARDVLEQYKGVELEDYFRDDCVSAFLQKRVSLEQLGEKTAVVYPVFLSDRVELLVSSGEKIQAVRLAVSPERLAVEAGKLRFFLEKRSTYQFLRPAKILYEQLLVPIEPLLEGIETLVFVPEDSLRLVPIAALFDGQYYLAERYAIATSPGLTLTAAKTQAVEKTQLLAAGLAEPRFGFSALPHVREELQDLERHYVSQVLLDENFQSSALEKTLNAGVFNWVHLASHGSFELDSGDNFILAYDKKLTLDDLDELLQPHKYRQDPINLLTLSACQTAVGGERAALGLAGVGVKAGATSALATLWLVNDDAASQLVRDFYRRYATGRLTKAQALAQAQQKLAQDGRFRHPGYWSAFLLIGNWL